MSSARLVVLVTGASGFLGRHLSNHFAAAGHAVLAAYRRRPPVDLRHGIEPVQLDLLQPIAIEAPVDVIVHAAAESPAHAGVSAHGYLRTNVEAARHVAEFARSHGTRTVIHLSTLSVYGDIRVPVVDAETPLFAPDAYGLSKYAAELMLASEGAFTSISLRLPGVVGPAASPTWLSRTVARALAHEPIAAFNPDALFNSVIDVDGVTRLVEHFAAADISGTHRFAVGAHEPVSVRALVSTIADMTHARSSITWSSGVKQSYTVDISSLRRAGFEPRSTAAILESYVRSFTTAAAVR
jgi:UDP-glucose 4-epimerase